MMSNSLLKFFKEKWKNYKFRFVPWVAVNMQNKNVLLQRLRDGARLVPSTSADSVVPLIEILRQMIEVFPNLIRPARYLNARHVSESNKKIMFRIMGFTIDRAPSQLFGGGTGVFVTKGKARKGQLVALYPGTIYKPFEPIFLPSINNPFVFRCIDGIHIDGKDRGLSKIIFKSCSGRDKLGVMEVADLSWLTTLPANPLNVGQYVNNHTKDSPSNVAYQELDLPDDFDRHNEVMRSLMPYASYNPSSGLPSRVVALVATQNIPEGTEILSSYLTLVGS